MSNFEKISGLVSECIDDNDNYVNLDTCRKNKTTTMNAKKEIYINHDFKCFSKDRNKLNSNVSALKIAFPHVISSNSTGKDEDENSTSDDLITNAFNTINRLILAPLIREQSRPKVADVFKDVSPMLTQAMNLMSLDDASASASRPNTITSRGFVEKRSYVRPKSLPVPKPKNTPSRPKPSQKVKSSQPKSSQPESSQPKQRTIPKNTTKSLRPTSSQPKSSQPKSSQPKSQPKPSQQNPKSSQQSIPALTRNKVWREWCGNVMDGRCFCCEETIGYEKWHCGHVIAREKGGSIEPDNLRPTCSDCNLGMGTLHMYEWILMNRLPGHRHLDPKDPVVRNNIRIVQATAKIGEKILWLEENGHITKTAANNYRRKIVSKRADLRTRVEVMEEVTDKYRQLNH